VRSRLIQPIRGALDARLEAPPSKSATHRALVLAALAEGPSEILGPLDADDTRRTFEGLSALGIGVEEAAGRWIVRGLGGRIPGGGTLWLGESGTSFRFLLAVASLGERPSRLDGAPRLRQRPIAPLARALSRLGARIERLGLDASLPLAAGGRSFGGGTVRLEAGTSSQFASALLLIGPSLRGGVELALEGRAVSLPYAELTVSSLRAFGVPVERLGDGRWRVPQFAYPGRNIRVEGDPSSASYFLAAAALHGGRVRIEGWPSSSPHPDTRFPRILERWGCEVVEGPSWLELRGTGRVPPFELDLSDAPDLVPTVAVLALFSSGPSAIVGVPHLRQKESDRLEALARGLRALGREAVATQEELRVGPPPAGPLRGARIETRSDHRIAMAFAIAGTKIGNVVIDDADCVAKSNPAFWDQLACLG
jgi:3-phosphoshikimate 1-carboxyvinyltransferase